MAGARYLRDLKSRLPARIQEPDRTWLALAAFNIGLLAQKGSLYATRPTLFSYADTRANLYAMADEMFALVRAGKIKSEARQTFALKDAAAAHRALEGRDTTGATVLLP